MRLILVILAVFGSAIASAHCGGNGIELLSKRSTLNKNGLILLEFYASSQNLISDLNKKYPVYLRSAKGKVSLFVIEILKGEFRVTQVVLKPGSELLENEIYKLYIDNLPADERMPGQYNRKLQKWETPSFTITNYFDYELPDLSCTPVETKKSFGRFGCGPSRVVYFQLSGQDKSELFVRASVKNKTTGKTTDYILEIKDGFVEIGHGMCSGAFHFDNGDNYEVTFCLFDQSGNKGGVTKAIGFTKPNNTTDDEENPVPPIKQTSL
jgi:hypothetical protein